MRKKLAAGLAVVVLALAGVGGWYWWNVLRFRQSTDDAYVQSDVSVISPKIEGYIKKVKVADNQEVAEGAILFVIDDRDFREPAQTAAIDDRSGGGGGQIRRGRFVPGATGLQAVQLVDNERFRQPAALRAGRSRCPQGRGGTSQEPRRARRRAEPARRAAIAAARGGGPAPAGARQSVAGKERSRQYGDPRTGVGNRRQPCRPSWPVRQARHSTVVPGAAAECL